MYVYVTGCVTAYSPPPSPAPSHQDAQRDRYLPGTLVVVDTGTGKHCRSNNWDGPWNGIITEDGVNEDGTHDVRRTDIERGRVNHNIPGGFISDKKSFQLEVR